MAHLIISSKDIRTLDGLYSLNDLHVVSGASQKHKPANFMRLETTQELIAEIDRCSDLSNTFKSNRGGADKGTWVCKELVYAYAMWISPKFNLEVIRAFDQAQQPEPEPVQQTLPAPIQDDEKLKLINDVAKSLGITESIAVVSATDIMAMIQTIRNYQQQLARIQTNPAWVDQTIERVKNATGRHFGEG
ncbi:KilA-N domain-containing protein [Marinomonas sp. FW-1]|uniref:KilA-N domain-containing protein n=1 Tax=Marinomonas sp. FW-1 TaxID=2071621 RepID=UPI0010C076A4|nr:KilA-N domain-containing protein [Marinomonas sp. FW-1]